MTEYVLRTVPSLNVLCWSEKFVRGCVSLLTRPIAGSGGGGIRQPTYDKLFLVFGHNSLPVEIGPGPLLLDAVEQRQPPGDLPDVGGRRPAVKHRRCRVHRGRRERPLRSRESGFRASTGWPITSQTWVGLNLILDVPLSA